jgi:DNA-binding NarL/FixJ family response regulator
MPVPPVPPDDDATMMQMLISGHEMHEIARVMDMPEATVRTRLRRLRKLHNVQTTYQLAAVWATENQHGHRPRTAAVA